MSACTCNTHASRASAVHGRDTFDADRRHWRESREREQRSISFLPLSHLGRAWPPTAALEGGLDHLRPLAGCDGSLVVRADVEERRGVTSELEDELLLVLLHKGNQTLCQT